MSSIAEEIAAIEAEASAKIQAVREKAASSLAKKIAEAKNKVNEALEELEKLQEEYAIATGKTVKGQKVSSTKRKRLTSEEKSEIAEKVKTVLRSHKEGAKLGTLITETGQSAGVIREALKILGKAVTRTGVKASTLYFSK